MKIFHFSKDELSNDECLQNDRLGRQTKVIRSHLFILTYDLHWSSCYFCFCLLLTCQFRASDIALVSLLWKETTDLLQSNDLKQILKYI